MKEIAIVAKQDTGQKDAQGKKIFKEIPGKAVQYSTIAEAVKGFGGDDKALAILNMQAKIRALDALRGGASPSLTKLFKTASPKAQEEIKKLLGLA